MKPNKNYFKYTVINRIKSFQQMLLGYRYNYNRPKNELIIKKVYSKFKSAISNEDRNKRLIDRTIAHYEAQLALRPLFSIVFFEIISYFILPLFLMVNYLKFKLYMSTVQKKCDGLQCVFPERWDLNKELFIIPKQLKNKNLQTYLLSHSSLNLKDILNILYLIFRTISFRNPFPIQLSLKCAKDISKLRTAIIENDPSFIIIYWEFSCSISFITYTLNREDKEVYNVMHGDKHYYAKHAFFEVNQCYCWNNYYIELFKEVFVKSEFIKFNNPAFELKKNEVHWLQLNPPNNIGIVAPHTSTLTDKSKDLKDYISKFSKIMNKLALNNNLTIRTHPKYKQDFDIFKKYLSNQVTIEEANERNARFFILESYVIIGTVSSILIEAAYLGKNVIIINTPSIGTVQNYHYLYNLPNVYIVNLEELDKKIYALNKS